MVERFERTGTDMFSEPGSQVNRTKVKKYANIILQRS